MHSHTHFQQQKSTQRHSCTYTQTHYLTHLLSHKLNKTAGQWILLDMWKQRRERLIEEEKGRFCFLSLRIFLHESGKTTGRLMCLSFSYLLWLLSEAPSSMKPAKFLNDECTLVRLLGKEANLISAKRGVWYWKSSGISPGTILEIFILIARMNWMCCSDKSTLPPRELYKWSITDLFVCLLHVCVWLPVSYFQTRLVLLLIACLLKQKLCSQC